MRSNKATMRYVTRQCKAQSIQKRKEMSKTVKTIYILKKIVISAIMLQIFFKRKSIPGYHCSFVQCKARQCQCDAQQCKTILWIIACRNFVSFCTTSSSPKTSISRKGFIIIEMGHTYV